MSNVRETATALAATLEEMTTRLARAADKVAALEATAEKVERRLARGTFQGEPIRLPEPEATKPGKVNHRGGSRPPGGVPALACYVGDADTPTLNAAVERLIRARPGITRAELVALTGCSNVNRVAGAIVHLQRSGIAIVNLGTKRLGRWAIAG